MLFTDGKLRSFEQMMRQKPRRPMSKEDKTIPSSPTQPNPRISSSRKEPTHEKQK